MSRIFNSARLASTKSSNIKNILESAISCQKRSIRTTAPLNEGPVQPGRLPSPVLRAPLRPVVSDSTVAQLHETEVARLVAVLGDLQSASCGGGGGGGGGGVEGAALPGAGALH